MSQQNVVTVNGARVLTPDLRIGNLLVHVVDRVLLPTKEQTILEILNDGGTLQSKRSIISPFFCVSRAFITRQKARITAALTWDEIVF